MYLVIHTDAKLQHAVCLVLFCFSEIQPPSNQPRACPRLVPTTLKSYLNLTHSLLRYYSVSIFCKVGAPGYIASVVFGIVVSVATACVIPSIDKVM